MSTPSEKKKIWFVYDGECQMCSSAAHALRIKKDYGSLFLINARESINDSLVQEVTRRGLDLDAGMVIYTQDKFYHGKDALKFMAQYGEASNAFTAICKSLFWSNAISSLTYPWMRSFRDWLLRRRNVGRIDNLNLQSEPTFKSIFGASWDSLPPVIKKHYANKPYTDDLVTVQGSLDLFCGGPIKALSWLFAIAKTIPPFSEKNVPVTVNFRSDQTTQKFHFQRTFHFNKRKPYAFRSYMLQIKDNEVMEVMSMGMCWRMLYSWENGKVVMRHNGYAMRFLGHVIPLPLHLLLGKAYAEEIPVDDDTFDMCVYMTHPLWGKFYEYKGRFKVTREA